MSSSLPDRSKLDYVKRTLDRRLDRFRQLLSQDIAQIERQAAAERMLMSGNTLVKWQNAIGLAAHREITEAAQFLYDALGEPTSETIEVLSLHSRALEDFSRTTLSNKSVDMGAAPPATAEILRMLKADFDYSLAGTLDDFSHGMLEGKRLRKMSAVNIENNILNSPNAVLQGGIGHFSNSVFINQRDALLFALDEIAKFPEFQQLPVEMKDEISDVEHALRREVELESPDQGRLKRWGRKLGNALVEAGLPVAAERIINLISQIFGA